MVKDEGKAAFGVLRKRVKVWTQIHDIGVTATKSKAYERPEDGQLVDCQPSGAAFLRCGPDVRSG